MIFESEPTCKGIVIYKDQKLYLDRLSDRMKKRLYPTKERRKKVCTLASS